MARLFLGSEGTKRYTRKMLMLRRSGNQSCEPISNETVCELLDTFRGIRELDIGDLSGIHLESKNLSGLRSLHLSYVEITSTSSTLPPRSFFLTHLLVLNYTRLPPDPTPFVILDPRHLSSLDIFCPLPSLFFFPSSSKLHLNSNVSIFGT